MTSTWWQRFVSGLRSASAKALARSSRAPAGKYPATYWPWDGQVWNDAPRPNVFDPAVRQFNCAFRLGDPMFDSPVQAEQWRAARRRVIDHVLKVVSQSSWRDNLVLRGSLLLKVWFGDAAREPGDLDWTITPKEIRITGTWADELFAGLIRRVCEDPGAADVGLLVDQVATDHIWTYERAPGWRVVFPWRVGDLPPGGVQNDFVFGEELAVPPALTPIPTTDGSGTYDVLAAGIEQSLAWKLLWLATDIYPQGKDLYDAVLLAERAPLSADVVARTFAIAGTPLKELTSPLDWNVDWDNFKLEAPWVPGDRLHWQTRLADALRPTFEALTGRSSTG